MNVESIVAIISAVSSLITVFFVHMKFSKLNLELGPLKVQVRQSLDMLRGAPETVPRDDPWTSTVISRTNGFPLSVVSKIDTPNKN